jgi:hypothetical protein
MACSSTLKVEAERSSETSVNICRATRHPTSGDYSSTRLKCVGSGPGFAIWASYGEGKGAKKGTRLEMNKKRPVRGVHWCIVTLYPWKVRSFSLFHFTSLAMSFGAPNMDRFCPFLPTVLHWLLFLARSGVPWIPSLWLVYITKPIPEATYFNTEDGDRMVLRNMVSAHKTSRCHSVDNHHYVNLNIYVC